MRRSFVAVMINALIFLCVSGAAYARFDHGLIGAGGHASFGFVAAGETLHVQGKVEEPLARIASKPASIALFGAGLLLVGGLIRRQRCKAAPRRESVL